MKISSFQIVFLQGKLMSYLNYENTSFIWPDLVCIWLEKIKFGYSKLFQYFFCKSSRSRIFQNVFRKLLCQLDVIFKLQQGSRYIIEFLLRYRTYWNLSIAFVKPTNDIRLTDFPTVVAKYSQYQGPQNPNGIPPNIRAC